MENSQSGGLPSVQSAIQLNIQSNVKDELFPSGESDASDVKITSHELAATFRYNNQPRTSCYLQV